MRKILFYPLMVLVPLSMAYAAEVTQNPKCGATYNYTDSNRASGSQFGPRKAVKTSTGYSSTFHKGIDIVDVGSIPTSNSYMDGVVSVGYNEGGWGKYVIVTSHDGNFRTLYGHASSISVQNGQTVVAGQTLGDYSGACTGSCAGAHIHYETHVKNENGDWLAVDPVIAEKLASQGICPGTAEFTKQVTEQTESKYGIDSSRLVSGASALDGNICL